MDFDARSLRNGIDAVSVLLDSLNQELPQRDTDEFSALCSQYVELRMRHAINLRTLHNLLLDPSSREELEQLRENLHFLRNEINSLRNRRLSMNVEPKEMQDLIRSAQENLEMIDRIAQTNTQEMNKSIKENEEKVQQIQKENEIAAFYENAFQKLTEFTGVIIEDTNQLRLCDAYTLTFTQESLTLTPSDFFVEDLIPNEIGLSACVSETIERIGALRHLTSTAKDLSGSLNTSDKAPVATLTTKAGVRMTFALMGYPSHPLIECNGIDVKAFNADGSELLSKIKRYLRKI